MFGKLKQKWVECWQKHETLTEGKVNLLTLHIRDQKLSDKCARMQYEVFETLLYLFVPVILVLILTEVCSQSSYDLLAII